MAGVRTRDPIKKALGELLTAEHRRAVDQLHEIRHSPDRDLKNELSNHIAQLEALAWEVEHLPPTVMPWCDCPRCI